MFSDTPVLELTLGKSLNLSRIKEGVDVYFECSVHARPTADPVRWVHNGTYLSQSDGVIITDGGTLVIQKVRRKDSGFYWCEAKNVEGTEESNKIQLNVKCEFSI